MIDEIDTHSRSTIFTLKINIPPTEPTFLIPKCKIGMLVAWKHDSEHIDCPLKIKMIPFADRQPIFRCVCPHLISRACSQIEHKGFRCIAHYRYWPRRLNPVPPDTPHYYPVAGIPSTNCASSCPLNVRHQLRRNTRVPRRRQRHQPLLVARGQVQPANERPHVVTRYAPAPREAL